MKKGILQKAASLFLVTVSAASAVMTGCSKTDGKTSETVLPGIPPEITEDTVWYSSERLEIDIGDEGDQIVFWPVYADDESIYLCAEVYSFPKTEEEWENGEDNWYDLLIRYSYKDKAVKWRLELPGATQIIPFKGGLIAMMSVQDQDTYQDRRSFYGIDEKAGTLGEEITDLKINTYLNMLPGGSGISEIFAVNGGTAFCVKKNDQDGTYTPVMYILADDGSVSTANLSTKCAELDIKNSIDFYKVDEDHIAVTGSDWMMYSDDNDSFKGFIYDIPDGTFLDLGSQSPLMPAGAGQLSGWAYCGNGLYCSDSYGINRYDASSDQEERSLDFNNTNIDRAEFQYDMRPLYSDDTTFVMAGMTNHSASDGIYVIYVFGKEDKNPNAGKKVITVADTAESFSDQMSHAIYEFNEKSDDVFVVMDEEYCLLNYLEEDEYDDYQRRGVDGSWQEDKAYWDRVLSERMTSKLRMDILSGKGPDVILNSSAYSELDNDAVFVDLKQRVTESGYDLYDNVISGFLNDGALYQIPLTFTVSGMVSFRYEADGVYKDNPVFDGVYGIAFEDYGELVKDRFNGKDYFYYNFSREELFMLLFRWCEKDMIKDGVFDADCAGFRRIAEYARDNAGERPYADILNENEAYDEMERYYADCNLSFGDGFGFPLEGIIGIPSPDGRGPMAYPGLSAAITTDCSDTDAAWEFLDYLLSEEGQGYLAVYQILINRDAQAAFAYEYMKDFLTPDPRAYMYDPGEPGAVQPTMPPAPSDEEIRERASDEIEKSDDLIANLSGVLNGNTDIETIVNEEMGAYFAGDKTIDEVIPIINDRVNTVLEERR